MTAKITAAPAATHAFVTMGGTTKCFTCGKSRNTKAHGYSPSRSGAASKAADAAAKETALREKAQRIASSTASIEEQVAERIELALAAAKVITEAPAEDTVAADLEAVADLPDLAAAQAEASEDAVTAFVAVYDRLTTNRTQEDEGILADAQAAEEALAQMAEEPWGTPAVPPMKPCDGTCCPPKATCETRDAIAAAKAEIEAAAAEVAAKPRKAAKPAATAQQEPGVKMTSLWVAKNMVDGLVALTASAAPAEATLGAKVRDKAPNAEGGRTIRLTPEELQALLTHAEQVETEATEAEDGTRAMSARKLQGRLAKLMA